MQSNKDLTDINECIVELKNYCSTTGNPINDDLASLHRFEETLESILLFGLREKPGLLGAKKSYWDYIYTCFTSTRRVHDGIIFVKSRSELKTSVGHGRAFIRYCLMQKCLADTLQICFMNQKVTRDYYSRKSLPFQTKLWPAFVSSLYELNELNFDLTPCHAELDATWPTFARKLFVSSKNTLSQKKVSSSSSSCSFSSQSEENIFYPYPSAAAAAALIPEEEDFLSLKKRLANSDMPELLELNERISLQNRSLHEEVQFLHNQQCDLEKKIKELKKTCRCMEQMLCPGCKKNTHKIYKVTVEKRTIAPQIPHKKYHPKTIDNCRFCAENSFYCSDFDYNAQPKNAHSISDTHNSTAVSVLFNENKLLPIKDICDNGLYALCDKPISVKTSHSENLVNSSEIITDSSSSILLNQFINANVKQVPFASDSDTAFKNDVMDEDHTLVNNSCDDEISIFSACLENGPFLPSFSSSKINKPLMEMKGLINDLKKVLKIYEEPVVSVYLSRLNILRDEFEIAVSDVIAKSKDTQNFFGDKYISCIKRFADRQSGVINLLQERVDLSVKRNDSLYSEICVLKDLLHSSGFLKVSEENKTNVKDILADSSLPSNEDLFCDILSDPYLTPAEPLVCIFKSSFSNLNCLNAKLQELQNGLASSQQLNSNLISGVQIQEMHLKGVTKEIEEAQNLVSVMKEQHKKLQSAEGILRYDLQEKRKLLTRLRTQLETTREDWNLVRLKNSKSEADWQNLRKEFLNRHKQTSEESGFADDKGLDEQNSIDINLTTECDFTVVNDNEKTSSSSEINAAEDHEKPVKKSRLELLEEQCQLLCSSLLQNSKKRQAIDDRLESVCKVLEKSNSKTACNGNISQCQSDHSFCCKLNDPLVNAVTEESESDGICADNFSSSFHSSSDVGSLNSEMNSYMPSEAEVTGSVDACSLKLPGNNNYSTMLCDSPNVIHDLQCSDLEVSDLLATVPSSELFMCPVSSPKGIYYASSYDCSELPVEKTFDSSMKSESLTHVDSLISRKKSLEESLKHLKFKEINCSSSDRTLVDSSDMPKQISELENEKRILQNEVLELKKEVVLISTELSQKSQQLILSKAAKEHEVAALQFQLNAEAIKYERALKEFNDQNNELEKMKKKISDQELLIVTLEKTLAEIKLERECEREHQWHELQDIQSTLESREQEYIALCQDLEKSCAFVEEERNKNELLLSQMEKFRSFSETDKIAMESELIHLQNDSRELRKKLIKLLKEKDILWKRNDYLSYLQKVKITDRWMNDHEVSSCLVCHSSFTFILRKHHCRLCGRIFCHSCSDNWLQTASSSKQIRACNSCYMQYMELQKAVKNGSGVPYIEDDSEDEDCISDCALKSSHNSFISEMSPCITNSVVSLPIKKIDYLKQRYPFPLSSSAPDLRCIFNQEEGFAEVRFSSLNSVLAKETDAKTNFSDEFVGSAENKSCCSCGVPKAS